MTAKRVTILLALAGLGTALNRIAAQTVSPGTTAVPPRIVEEVEGPAPEDGGYLFPSTIAPLAEMNKRLPEWIRFDGHDRLRFEDYSGLNYKSNHDGYLLNRFRVGMLLHPMRGFRVYAELQDARAFWKTPPLTAPYQNIWHMRQGYVQLGGREDQTFGIKVGRQQVNFGAGRLIGYSDWRNAGGTFDAALATLHVQRFRLTAFSLSAVVPNRDGFSHHVPGNAVHGLYGGIDDVIPHSVIEPYVFWHVAPGFRTDARMPAKLNEWTIGARWAGMVTPQFDYAAELAHQTGNIATDSLGAWMSSLVGGYTLSGVRTKPRFFGEYFFASGNETPGDGHHGTWDQLYPTNHDRNGMADQVGWQNLKEFRAGVRLFVARNWAVAGVYNDWYLASARDAFYNAAETVIARDPTGRSGTHIGQELDLEASYRINRQVELGAGIGHIVPGQFLRKTTPGKAYTFPYVMITYHF